MTYRSSCNQTTLETAYDGFAHFGKDRRELVSVTLETWKDGIAYHEDIHEKAAEYRLCDGVLAPVIVVKQFPCACCEYQAPAIDCVAICTYQAIAYNYTNPPTVWNWVVVGGTIISGQGTDTIDVQTTGSQGIPVDITVVVTDPSSGDTSGATGVIEQCHTDTTTCPIFIGPPFGDATYNDGDTLSGFTTADRFFGYITTYALVGAWPEGLTIDPQTGVISGSLDGVGVYSGLQISAFGDGRCPYAYSNVFSIEIVDAQEEGLTIAETVPGACDWVAGTGGCTATGTYVATPSGFNTPPDTWVWEVLTANATIETGQGTDTVTVSTTGGVDVTFTLQATASNTSNEEASTFGQFTHTHTDTVEETLLVSEVSGGSCEYQAPSTSCVTTGTYTATPGGFNIAPDNWVWEVLVGAATIENGQGTATVVVRTDAASDTQFTLKATATNLYTGETANDSQVFTHPHTEVSSVLLNLPLLQNRYEAGGTNHALLSRASEAYISPCTGNEIAEIDEFRFENANRVDAFNGIDYGAGALGIYYEDICPNGSHGLMVYQAGDNYASWSQDFLPSSTGGYWSNIGLTNIEENYATAPDGTETATLVDFTGGSSSRVEAIINTSDNTNQPFTASIYFKESPNAGNRTPFAIFMFTEYNSWNDAKTITMTPTADWQRVDLNRTDSVKMRILVGNSNADGTGNNSVDGEILIWGAQMNSTYVLSNYVPTFGTRLIQALDDVHCLWPAGVVNDFTLSLEWVTGLYDLPATLLESGDFRIFYTTSDVRVTNGNGTAIFTMVVVPDTLYYIQVELSSTSGITIKVNTVSGTPNASTADITPATDLQIGARANLTEFINGTIKNIYMETI